MGFRALSVDVVTAYAYGDDHYYNSLDAEDFGAWYNELIKQIAPMMFLLKIVPWLKRPLQGMPHWLARRVNPLVIGLLDSIRVSCRLYALMMLMLTLCRRLRSKSRP